jgi:Carboxypeptidase regulatory-like domain
MDRRLLVLLLVFASYLSLNWGMSAVGQVLKASISGTVVDAQGAVVANAQVKATHVTTGTVLNTKSDGAGLFRFNLIPTGTYMVEIS